MTQKAPGRCHVNNNTNTKTNAIKTTIAMFKSMELQDLLEKAEDRLKRSFDDELEVGNQEGWESSNIKCEQM